MSVMRAVVVNVLATGGMRSFVVELVEYVLGPANGATRHPAGEYLRHGRDIGDHTVICLSAAGGNAEAGYHLIEDKQRTLFLRDLAQHSQHFRRRRYDA